MVARQLCALFQSILPKTPKLVSAYGLRASQISQDVSVNSKGSSLDGFFGDCVGADITSLSASAISGSVAARLLACMLACISPRPSTGFINELMSLNSVSPTPSSYKKLSQVEQ